MQWITIATSTAVVAIAMSGCGHSATKAEFGDAVRHTTEQQIYNRDAAYNPDPAPVFGADVERLNNTLDAHRTTISDPAASGSAPATVVGGRSQ